MKEYGSLPAEARPLLLAVEDALAPLLGALGTRMFLASVTGLSASRVEKIILEARNSAGGAAVGEDMPAVQ